MSYGVDKWLGRFTLDSSNKKFRLNDYSDATADGVATEIIVSASEQDYYLHASNNSDYPGLFYDLIQSLNASAANNVYSIDVVTPTLSTGQVGGGVRISSDGYFEIDFSDADFTIDERFFGFPTGTTNVAATLTSNGSYVVDSQFTCWGQWISHNEFGGLADDKRSRRKNNSRRSHGRSRDAYLVTWNRDEIRTITYPHVPAAHIFEDRALGDVSQDIYAEVAALHSGDNHNAFETVWENGLRQLDPILILHDTGDQTVFLDGNWDAVILEDEPKSEDFFNCLKVMRRGGEYYELDLGDLYLKRKGYDH